MNNSLSESTFHFMNDEKVMCAAVAVIWTNQNEIILIKRAEREGDPWSGHIGFPGGRLEEMDKGHPFQTAIREAKEEIGVELDQLDCLELLTPLLPDKDFRGYKLELWPYLFKVKDLTNIKIDENEVQKIIKISANIVLNKLELWERDFTFVDGKSYRLPCLTLPTGDVVWGLTLMILKEFHQKYGRNNK